MRFLRWLSVVGAALSFLGCASVSEFERTWTRNFETFPLPVWTDDGLYLVSGRSGALFLHPSLPEFDANRGVILEEIQITTAPGSRDLKPSEIERLKGYFTRRLERIFARNGWPIVDERGADVLQLRVAVKDVDIRRWRRSHHGTIVAGRSTAMITIALELRDPASSERLLLYGDRRRLPFGVYSGSDLVSIRRVEDAFYYFSIDVSRRLDEVQRGEFPPPQRPS